MPLRAVCAGTRLSARNHCVWVLLAVVVIVIVLFIFSQSADVVLALGLLSADDVELELSVSHTLHGRELSSASAVCDARVAHIVASQGLLVTSRRLLGERSWRRLVSSGRVSGPPLTLACLHR